MNPLFLENREDLILPFSKVPEDGLQLCFSGAAV